MIQKALAAFTRQVPSGIQALMRYGNMTLPQSQGDARGLPSVHAELTKLSDSAEYTADLQCDTAIHFHGQTCQTCKIPEKTDEIAD